MATNLFFIKSSNINHILDIEGGSVDIITLLDSESPNKFWYNVFTAWSTVIKIYLNKK